MTIHILPPELANQIAAGEVVERPASIIKELVENSIDADANRIDIDIEQGGCKLIRIRDNGCGIPKEQLALALARHATSKISSLDDLEAIMSLGFRGEALASISSVSRLTLTSKPENQTEAWLVYAEGRNMLPIVKPATHPTGTTVEVLDIFYNTPARRRFLKTEKTEFSHIDEVIRRIALAYPYVAFNFQHNGKLVKQYRAAESEQLIEKRVATICGLAFIQKAIQLSWQHDDLFIKGWIASNTGQEQTQYFFVNGRIVKDRLLNHALKQAFQEVSKSSTYSTDETLSYIIYLQLDPHQLDVNVHPAKHEVRFHEARLVHDFVRQAIVMALDKQKTQTVQFPILNSEQHHSKLNDNRAAAGKSIFDINKDSTSSVNLINKSINQTRNVSLQKVSHINDNRLYSRLVEPSVARHTIREGYVSDQQLAIIESLFPKRSEPLATVEQEPSVSGATQLGKVLTIINNQYVLLEKKQNQQQKISLLSLGKAQLTLFRARILADRDRLSVEHLLIPLSILLSRQEQQMIQQAKPVLEQLNFAYYLDKSKLQLTAVPKLMRKANWQQLLPSLLSFLSLHVSSADLYQHVCHWLTEHYMQLEDQQQQIWTIPKAIQLLIDLEQLDDQQWNRSDVIKPIDLSTTIALFN